MTSKIQNQYDCFEPKFPHLAFCECEDGMWGRIERMDKESFWIFFHEKGFQTLPLNSEETKFYFTGERVLMRSMFNSPFTNIQVGFF